MKQDPDISDCRTVVITSIGALLVRFGGASKDEVDKILRDRYGKGLDEDEREDTEG